MASQSGKRTKKVIDTSNVGNSTGVLPVGTVVYKNTWISGVAHGDTKAIVELIVLEDGVVPKDSREKYVPEASYQQRKCRVPLVYVKSIKTKRGGVDVDESYSYHNTSFKYKVGSVVKPLEEFNSDPSQDCVSGIHVFRTRKEAESWA